MQPGGMPWGSIASGHDLRIMADDFTVAERGETSCILRRGGWMEMDQNTSAAPVRLHGHTSCYQRVKTPLDPIEGRMEDWERRSGEDRRNVRAGGMGGGCGRGLRWWGGSEGEGRGEKWCYPDNFIFGLRRGGREKNWPRVLFVHWDFESRRNS